MSAETKAEGGDIEMEATVEPVEEAQEKVNVGHEIVTDLIKAFQVYLDERKWRNVRYCVSCLSLNSLIMRCSN